jgi:type IV pilus secretin PilQ/predicted competence protein
MADEKSWAVFSFDKSVLWIGMNQAQNGSLSLYLVGKAGKHHNSTVTIDSVSRNSIFIKQMSRKPPIFRVDIQANDDMPLAVLKSNSHLVLAIRNERLIESTITGIKEIPSSIGYLENVIPRVTKSHVVTTFEFDGTFEWIGYVRQSFGQANLMFSGAELKTQEDTFEFKVGPLQSVRLLSRNLEVPVITAQMHLQSDAEFSIVKKMGNVLVQMPYVSSAPSSMETDLTTPFKEKDKDLSLTGFENDTSLQQQDEPVTDRDVTIKPVEDQIEEDYTIVEDKSDDGIPWDKKVTSLRFKSTSLKDALRLIAISNGLNMVIAEGVKDSVTLNLEEVTLKQALDNMIHTHGYEYIVDGNIITVQPISTEAGGNKITKIYRLKYADANNFLKVIQKVITNPDGVEIFYPEFLDFTQAGTNRIKSDQVAVQGIRRASIIVVTDRPDKIRQVDKIIEELDRQPVLIMIESKLVEISPTAKNELGIDWQKTLGIVWNKNAVFVGDDEGGQSYSPGFHVDNDGKFQADWEWKMGNLNPVQYSALLDILKTTTETKLISNPRLLAMDNEESSISVGQTVPIPRIQRGTGGAGDMVTFDYKEINIQLNVSPHIGENGDIIMYVNPVIEEIASWVKYGEQEAPITNKRAVNSIVTVKNGETVVIGGLIKNQLNITTKKLWLLGSLPLLGKLFQHEIQEDKQTDLMIFITPTIIETG